MDFGLGLVLSFTDNATAGINNAVNSLSQLTSIAENASTSLDQMASLSALSVVSDQMGSAFLSAGGTIISTLGQVISKVNETGQTLMFAENQLNALYANSGKTGKEVIGQIQEYAKTSMFEFENLIPAVISLKSVGIEAFDSITSSMGESKYTLLDYASALASFAPQMRNAYGTGINAAIGALREYIAEGNALSLKRGAGIDITGILGEEKGASIEERTRQVADLIEQMGMLGMVEVMKDNPMTQLSNMGDTLFQLLGMISSSGVYDKFTEFIGKLAGYVNAIPEEELQNIANVIGSALTSIMTPLEWVIDKVIALADCLRNLVATNPELVKIATVGVAVVGVLLVLAGVALKVTSAMSGLSLMLLTMGKTFGSIGGLIKTGSLKILSTLLPLTATIGLLALAWKSDFAGIRTNVTYFMNGLVNSFNTARNAVNGSVSDLKVILADLNSKDDFFSNLTVGLMEVMMLFKALADGWNDYTLSEENFLKAKELGILPLVEAILDLKYRFEFFKQGFIDGWREIGENVKNAVMGFLDNIEGTALETLVDNLTEFLQKLASGDTQAWYDFGHSFAEFTAKAVAFWATFKVVGKVLGMLTKVVTFFMGIKNVISSVVSFIKGLGIVDFVMKIVEVIQLVAGGAGTLHEALVAVFGTVGTVVAGIASVISGAVLAVINFFDMLKNGFSWLKEILMVVGIALVAIGAIILGAPALIAGVVAGIVALIATLVVVIKDNWAKICEFFSTIGTWIYDNVIKPVADFFVGLWNGIVTGVTTAFNAVKSFLSTIANWIYTNVIMPVVNFFMTYIYPFIEKIVEIVAKIIEIVTVLVSVFVQWVNTNVVQPIVSFFQNLWNSIVTIFQNVATWFTEMFTSAVNGIKTAFSVIGEFFSGVWSSITTVFANVVTWFSDKFSQAVEAIKSFFSPLGEFFRGVWDSIVTIFTSIGAKISDAISGAVKGAINTVLSGAAGIINGFISAINFAIDVINAIPGVSISKITPLSVPALATGGVIESPTVAMIGEAGTEAVMPLENNTQWIGRLASMITTQMDNIRPANSQLTTTNNQGDVSQQYLTNNNTNSNQTIREGDDNSVVFNEGAIQITVQNASEEEALRLAQMVMEYIKRQKELDRMVKYA